MLSILDRVRKRTQLSKRTLTLEEYLHLCKEDPNAYANAYQRLLNVVGEPKIIDTAKDARLGRIFQNRKLKTWDTFKDFFGMEPTIEHLYTYLTAAAQGLEESHQILYFLGPVGGGKSSLAERLKDLMEKTEFYAIKDCPIHESPLDLFDHKYDAPEVLDTFGIPRRYLTRPLCPYCIDRLRTAEGDASIFEVELLTPSRQFQIAIAKTEPADESTQDVSTLVGKVDVRRLGDYAQDDPKAYMFSGGLCKAHMGILDFVEMFKAPIKVLNPLLTATQEGNYNPTESLSALPWDGVICAHSNESEWDQFRNNRTNEAFLDRIYLVRVPYCLRRNEEIAIYRKMLINSELSQAPCAAETLEMLAEWSVLSRLKIPENSTVYTKMKVYNGEILKDTDPKAKSLHEYQADAGVNEGMTGMSTRFAFKVLSRTFNQDYDEVAANPVHLMHCLQNAIIRERLPEETEKAYLNYIKEHLQANYLKKLEKMLQQAYLESYADYGQNMFDRYFMYADAWIQETDLRDPETHQIWDRNVLNAECEKIEKPAGIANPKDFRNEIVQYVLRFRAANSGDSPKWNEYEKIKEVIEARIFSNTDEILPVIAFGKKASEEDERKHQGFVERMIANDGITERQVRLLVK